MRDASTPKRKLTTKIFHVNSFVVLFSYISLLIWQFKILIECFSSHQFDEIKHVSDFVVYIIKFILFNPWRYSAVSSVSLGAPVLCKGLIYLYQNNILRYI